jgi:hypothetical protein
MQNSPLEKANVNKDQKQKRIEMNLKCRGEPNVLV